MQLPDVAFEDIHNKYIEFQVIITADKNNT